MIYEELDDSPIFDISKPVPEFGDPVPCFARPEWVHENTYQRWLHWIKDLDPCSQETGISYPPWERYVLMNPSESGTDFDSECPFCSVIGIRGTSLKIRLFNVGWYHDIIVPKINVQVVLTDRIRNRWLHWFHAVDWLHRDRKEPLLLEII